MRILYLSLSYVPSRRASSIQVMRSCSAYAQRGHDITLVAKRYDEPSARGTSVHEFYGVPPTFRVDLAARPSRRGGGLVYAFEVARRVLAAYRHVDLVYCRDLPGAALAVALGMPVVLESHGVPEIAWQKHLWDRAVNARSFVGLVVVSNALRDGLAQMNLLPRNGRVVVARNATEPFAGSEPRAEVGSPPRIGYVGNLYENRGLEIIVDLARELPHCRFELVGGAEKDLARWRGLRLSPNIVLHGFQPPSRLREIYHSLDVLLMPYPREGIYGPTGGADSSRYCSPIKMFEYMASGVPVIASDLAVLQEVLTDGENALIAPAMDVGAWRAAIERLLGDRELRVAVARKALSDLSTQFTPEARAARVFQGLGIDG